MVSRRFLVYYCDRPDTALSVFTVDILSLTFAYLVPFVAIVTRSNTNTNTRAC